MSSYNLLLSIILHLIMKLDAVNYVRSNSSSTCPIKAEVCFTFQEYVSFHFNLFKTNSIFVFLPGNHSCSRFQIKDTFNLRFEGLLQIPNASKLHTAIEFKNSTNISIMHLTLITVNSVRKTESSFVFAECRNVCLHGVVIEGSTDSFSNHSSAITIQKSNMTMENCTLIKNSALFGGAISVLDNSILSLSNVRFAHNVARNCGGAIFADKSNIMFYQSNVFYNNTASNQGGGLCCFKCNITSKETLSFSYNRANNLGGAIYLRFAFGSFHNIRIFRNLLTAIMLLKTNITFSGETIMNENKGKKGGAIYANTSSVIFKGYALFEQNYAEVQGGAICGLFYVLLTFSGLSIFRNNSAYIEGGGALLVAVHSELNLNGNVTFLKNNCTTCYGGGLSITLSSKMIIWNNVTFKNNWGEMGGAIYFRYSNMILKEGSNLVTIENKAKYYGGAFFHFDSINYYQCSFDLQMNSNHMDSLFISLPDCFISLENFLFSYNISSHLYQIESYMDTSGVDGNFLYGGLLDKCVVYDTSNYFFQRNTMYNILVNYHILAIVQTNNTTGINSISSEAFTLCFCEGNMNFDCMESANISVVRGAPFKVSVLALSQGNTITATVIIAEVSKTASLQLNQTSRNLPAGCTSLTYNMFSILPKEELALYTNETCRDIGNAVAVVLVHFQACPDGFNLSIDKCDCEKRLLQYNAHCFIATDGRYVIQRGSYKFWVKALYSDDIHVHKGRYEGLILYKSCPLEYCRTDDLNISLEFPDVQCNFNHSGMLCGACADNYSLIFGNSKCQLCSNKYLFTIPIFALAGLLLVLFLTIFRLTVATGTVNSIILYANIVQANRNLFLPDASNNILTIFIAWMNLDIGFPTCFYHGMNAYTHTWLQFVFPIYIWVLIAFIIITSRYSKFMTKLIGSNPIAVLATLLLMSYAKLLKTIIQIFSFAYLDYPQNLKMKVWLKDANVPYLKNSHLYLAVFGSLFIATFFLPYTLLLFLGFKLYRYSDKPCIHWLLLKLKPLLDSYYAPYQKHTRYWTGFLLLLHCVLYIVFSFNPVGGSDNSLLAITTGYTTVIVIAWLSVKIYKKIYVNVIEASVFLDLIILSAGNSNNIKSPVLAYTLISFVFFLAIGILMFQFHQVYLTKCFIWYLIVSKVKSLYKWCTQWLHLSKEERDSLSAAMTDEDFYSSNKFRESLLENYVSY